MKSGAENSKLMVIPGMTHTNPGGVDLDAAIQYLDSRISLSEQVDQDQDSAE